MAKQRITNTVIPKAEIATRKTKFNEGSPLLRLTGDEFATTAESSLYHLDAVTSEISGTSLTNNGTITFALDTDLAETVGTLNGSSQYYSLATEASVEVGTGSFVASIQFRTTLADAGSNEVFMYGDSDTSEQFWGLKFQAGKLRADVDDGTTAHSITEAVADRWNDDKWHTAIMMFEAGVGTSIWCDGEFLGQVTSTIPTLTLDNVGESLRIGVKNTAGLSQYFLGSLANFHLIKAADYNAVAVLNQGFREAVANGSIGALNVAATERLNNSIDFINATGEYVTTVIDVEEGLYEFQTIGTQTTGSGILQLQVDGVTVHTVDNYVGSTLRNVLTTTKDISLSAGKHVLKYLTESKNGSSSGFSIFTAFMNIIKRDGHEEGGATEFLLLGDEFNRTNIGTSTVGVDTATYYNTKYETAAVDANDGDYREGDLFIKGGTWRIDFVYITLTDAGDYDLDFGNVEVLSLLDGSAATAKNVITTKIVKLNQGKTNVRLAINGNAGGGTDFRMELQFIRGVRVGN